MNKLAHNRKALLAAAAALVIVFVYLRSRSSSSSSSSPASVDPAAIDPATGVSYAAEQQAALAAEQQGGTIGGPVGGAASTDQITTPSGESLSGALTDFTSGLAAVQNQQANDETLLQSASEAAAQAEASYAALTSLGPAGPQGAGAGAGSPATISNSTVYENTNTISGGTVYQAPVTINDQAPAAPTAPKTPAPAPSPVPKATIAPKAPVVELTARAGATKGQRPG